MNTFVENAFVLKIIDSFKSLYEKEGFKKYFKNTSWLFLEKGLRLISGIVVGALVARFLGPEKFGLLNYAMSFVGLFLAFSTLGLDSIVVRELVKSPSDQKIILGTAFRLKIMAAFVVLLALLLSCYLMQEELVLTLMILVIGVSAIFQSFNVIDFYFQSTVQSKYVVYSNIISLSISAIIKLLLIFWNANLFYFAAVFTFDLFIVAIGLVYHYIKSGNSIFKWEYSKQKAQELMAYSWPLILASVVVTIYMKIDQIMINEMLSSEANGNYAAAVRISEAWYFIPMVLSSSLFPAILNAKERKDSSYLSRMQQLYDFMVIVSLAIAIPVTFLGDWIIQFLYGSEYIESAKVLVIHIWAGIFVSLGIASSSWLISENLQRISMLRTSLGAVVNILLNFWLIPKYGIIGASLTTLVSQITAAWLFDLFYKQTRDTFVMKLKSLFLINTFKRIIKL